MKFSASHVSFTAVEDGWVLALADSADGVEQAHILLSFAEREDDQDRELGLTGVFLATKPAGSRGYGLVDHIDFDGQILSVTGRHGVRPIEITIKTDVMSSEDIRAAVDRCNRANLSRPSTP